MAAIPKYLSAGIKPTAIAHQTVPVIMTDFVPEVTEQSAVRLPHGIAARLAFDIVGLR